MDSVFRIRRVGESSGTFAELRGRGAKMLSDRPGKGRPALETDRLCDVGDTQRASRQQVARAF